jgi:hypothetical protein
VFEDFSAAIAVGEVDPVPTVLAVGDDVETPPPPIDPCPDTVGLDVGNLEVGTGFAGFDKVVGVGVAEGFAGLAGFPAAVGADEGTGLAGFPAAVGAKLGAFVGAEALHDKYLVSSQRVEFKLAVFESRFRLQRYQSSQNTFGGKADNRLKPRSIVLTYHPSSRYIAQCNSERVRQAQKRDDCGSNRSQRGKKDFAAAEAVSSKYDFHRGARF